MNKYIFIISTLDGCSHCVNFKNNINPSGITSLEELKNKVKQLNYNIEIMEINRSNNIDTSILGKLSKNWYPSFYLFTPYQLNTNPLNGYVMGGIVKDGVIIKDGSRISLDIDKIIQWIKSKINVNNVQPYTDYTYRLNTLI
uniref:Thioredoxin-fold protein n=1 Tax=Pithovirus LCPAC102 TaxID=2506587 RepID=A0A4D5XFA8_9VIRU|nr:MAG: thioredoxin-fold protein [Pithovirus LCPAC102]